VGENLELGTMADTGGRRNTLWAGQEPCQALDIEQVDDSPGGWWDASVAGDDYAKPIEGIGQTKFRIVRLEGKALRPTSPRKSLWPISIPVGGQRLRVDVNQPRLPEHHSHHYADLPAMVGVRCEGPPHPPDPPPATLSGLLISGAADGDGPPRFEQIEGALSHG